jgi:hypothetical protein
VDFDISKDQNPQAEACATSPVLECGSGRVYVSGRPESHHGHFEWTARAYGLARTTLWDKIVKETAWRLRRIDDEKF